MLELWLLRKKRERERKRDKKWATHVCKIFFLVTLKYIKLFFLIMFINSNYSILHFSSFSSIFHCRVSCGGVKRVKKENFLCSSWHIKFILAFSLFAHSVGSSSTSEKKSWKNRHGVYMMMKKKYESCCLIFHSGL